MASSVNANAVLCVKGEIHNVLTALRLNSRWASRDRFTREIPLQAESPLARAFKGLHSHLEEVDNLANVDTVRYLLPFLAVVESPATTGPMTGVALSSLHKFLLYGFIRKDCPRVKEGITLVAQAITRCHFEETDPDSDQLVLMKLLELSALCLRCEVGDLLEDESCWNIFLTCYNLYNITTDEKAYGLLRDTAGNTLAHIVLMLFSCPRVARASSAPAPTPTAAITEGREVDLTKAADGTASATRVSREPSIASPKMSAEQRSNGGGNAGISGRVKSGVWRPIETSPKKDETDVNGTLGDGARGEGVPTRHASVAGGPEEEEPWPSLDGAGEDSASRGVDNGVVIAGRGALKAIMGSGVNVRSDSGGGGGAGVAPSPEEAGTTESIAGNHRKETDPLALAVAIEVPGSGAVGNVKAGEEESVLVKVMRFLSLLSDPRSNRRAECVLSLSLINIALEAGGADLGRIPALVRVMRGDLCKHLLQNSQTDDLDVLSLTLRVVFNLFNSIKDHLKVQLEVFLTSVHLRVLDGSNYGPEQQELALESLLEFTREPALMLDVYINYDCDVQCTNLFETICHSLSSHALPRDGSEVNALNRLALEGVLAVIDSISRRCQPHPPHPPTSALASHPFPPPTANGGFSTSPDGGDEAGRRGSVSDSDSDQDAFASGRGGGISELRGRAGSDWDAVGVGDELSWLERARARTAEVLQERKKIKRRLGLAAQRFNSGSKEWLEYAQELGLIPTPATAAATAAFLKRTVLLDKSMLGEYLSRGPPEKYPFHAQVLEEFVKLFDMREKSFVESLRAFLKEFRLPGEAQCIDRLMEAFAAQQYEQGKGSGRHPFVDADAAFTMAFSAIMLNTDLHNPQIQESRRMSVEDFIRNNRQINGNKDLPREFLVDIFHSIKGDEIQVHRDHVSMAADGLGIDYNRHWDGILNRSNSVASASFTPSRAARKHLFPAGVHERDMLLSVTGPASEAMRAVFLRTQDDLLVLRCLRGFRSHARACVYLGLLAPFDSALVFFFQRGLEYASAAAEGAAGPPFPEVLKTPGLPDVTDMAACAPFASGCVVHRDLLALKCGLELARAYAHCVSSAWGPLLECVLALADLQALPARLTDVDDFGDAQGNPLPPSVFARRCRDRARSGQNVLLSQSGRSKSAAASAAASAGGVGGGGLWGSLSGVLFSRAGEGAGGVGIGGGGLGRKRGSAAAEAAIGALAEVVNTVQLERLFPQTKDLPLEVVEGLLGALLTIRNPAEPRRTNATAGGSTSNSSGAPDRSSGISSGGGGVGEMDGMAVTAAAAAAAASFEAHAVLALELASRVVLANRHRIARLWPALHSFLARVLGGEGSVTMTRTPFLVERAVVTVLRACIHLLDREDMGALLLQSLKLLLSLQADFVLPLSNRLASGLLLLVQANASVLSLPSTASQWEVIAVLMEKAILGNGGRGFVLEALAFIVNRGLGLLGRQNVFVVHMLLTRLAKGDFGDGDVDLAWSLQACAVLESMTFTLLQDLHAKPPKHEDAESSPHQRHEFGSASSVTGNGMAGIFKGIGDGAPESLSPPGVGVTAPGKETEVVATLNRDEAEGMWLSTLQTMGVLAGSSFPKVAKGAADALERLVLELHGVRSPVWGTAFAEVLLELPVRFLPPNYRPAADEVVRGTWSEEVCLRCCKILSRAFLHHLQALSSLQHFGKLWLDIVGLLCQNLEGVSQRGEGDDHGADEEFRGVEGVAAESCQQILTNMVMVLAYAGLLGDQRSAGDTGPGDASGGTMGGGARRGGENPHELLSQTRQLLEPVCPGLRPLLIGLAGERSSQSESSASPVRLPQPRPTPDEPELSQLKRELEGNGLSSGEADASQLISVVDASPRSAGCSSGEFDDTVKAVRDVAGVDGKPKEEGKPLDSSSSKAEKNPKVEGKDRAIDVFDRPYVVAAGGVAQKGQTARLQIV